MKSKNAKLRSILLVDDDHSNNFINQIFIGQLGLDVTVDIALDGVEALQHLRNSFNGPCLLILDLQMPNMDGWAFLDAYDETIPKKIKDQVVIVVITISAEQSDKVKARKSPYVLQFIQKPLSDLKFQRLIKKHF